MVDDFLMFLLVTLLLAYIVGDPIIIIKLTFFDIEFSEIKKILLIYIFCVIIVGFYFKFHYKVI